ncbi:major facilitator superfamily domain-containing protein [Mycena floridula]|nr:major facilitator superfamily domain-containing protein [Mycena floridula]
MATPESPSPSDLEQHVKASSTDSSSALVITVNPALDKKVWFKLDAYVLPVVTMFYLLSFLDRTNLGNARVAGLQTDLKMSNRQYSIALTVTYVPYILAELPSNLMLKAVGPNRMLPTMLALWGVVTTLQGVVTSYKGLLACRFFLGMLEGGVFPGLVLYLSFFYPRRMMNMRVSVFFSAASLSGAFSGLLAFGIINIKHTGRPSWAWIFIIEGLFTVLFGISAYWLMPRSPATAYFLNQEEKDYLTLKLKEDYTVAQDDTLDKFSWKEVKRGFLLPQVYFLAVLFFLSGVILYSLAYFTPTIVATLGFKNSQAQLMTVPPFAVAFVISLLAAYISDHYDCRGYITIVSSVLCVVGFAMFLGSSNKHVRYGSLFLSIPGTYTAAPTLSSWSSNNAAPNTRRATAIAIGFIMTNSGGILSTWLLGYISVAPKYRGGIITLLTMSAAMILVAICNILYLKSQNRKKAQTRAIRSRHDEDPALGDKSAWFIYNL